MSWKVHIDRNFRENLKSVIIFDESSRGVTAVESIVLKDLSRAEIIPVAIQTTPETVDAAWEEGIKPRQIEDLGGELKATKFHLKDMRKLVKGVYDADI